MSVTCSVSRWTFLVILPHLPAESWSEWSDWTVCDPSGVQIRARQCILLFPVGSQCSGNATESRPCVFDSNFIPGKEELGSSDHIPSSLQKAHCTEVSVFLPRGCCGGLSARSSEFMARRVQMCSVTRCNIVEHFLQSLVDPSMVRRVSLEMAICYLAVLILGYMLWQCCLCAVCMKSKCSSYPGKKVSWPFRLRLSCVTRDSWVPAQCPAGQHSARGQPTWPVPCVP